MQLPKSFLILLLIGITFIACQSTEQNLANSQEEVFDKEYPNDLFTFQRTYPFRTFDVRALDKGLQQARQSSGNRNASPGLDEAWTIVGPGNFGGRVNTVAVHPSDEDIIYLGFATGGVFKTTNGGSNWEPIFDGQSYLAIGDIALDPVDPDIIYVGTGDPNISGYPAIGDGLYRSVDGGATWDFLGLQDQRIISKIIIDPSDTDVIYVSCMGLPFERNNDRGLYKTVDGGTTWQQVLFVSNQSGIIDMVMDPTDSEVLYATSWDRIRNNEESTVAGPNGKIHKTTDGGLTWSVLSNGLPSNTVGRIGLDISQSNPDVLVSVYINSSSNLQGVYKTEDGGASWSTIPTAASTGLSSNVMGGFGWYFGQIRLHPNNDDWIYLLGVQAWVTSNNGTNWSLATGSGGPAPHVDYHDLVFNYQDDIIIGNDGGAYKRESNGSNYVDIENLPTTQFYRVAYDPHRPDNFYGGTQDNGTLAGTASGVNNWTKLIGGDGFQLQFDPVDSNTVFVEQQRGVIYRSINGLSGYINNTSGILSGDRRHWDMQYMISPHAPNRLYTGTYRVYKTETNGSLSWQPISDDLTDGVLFGDAFHTITTIDESPQVEGLLYVGTTDANVWRSEDGGMSWDSIHSSLPERYITSVKADPDSADRVFVTISGYRYDEYIPRVYQSDDRGATWTSIAGNLPDLAVNDIIIVPDEESQVLFVATDGGVYVTTNGGTHWERLGANMPYVTIYDMTINKAQNLLVAGTFGRSIYTYPIDSILNNVPASFSINGQVRDINGVGVDSVNIAFGNMNYAPMQVNAEGQYQLDNLTSDAICTIEPKKNINIRNGISTFDMLLMQRHILQLDTLDTPYQILAGDVNSDGKLSTFDVLINRRVLLQLQDTFIGAPSWKFVVADYVFQDPIDPFAEDYSTVVTCSEINSGTSGDFIGIKMGDVNGSANPGMFSETPDNRSTQSITLSFEDRMLRANETYVIPFKIEQAVELLGLQLGLRLDSSVVFAGLTGGKGLDIAPSHLNYDASESVLRLSWSRGTAIKLNRHDAVIYLKVSCLRDMSLSKLIAISDDYYFANEAYHSSDQIERLILSSRTISEKPTANTLTVFPNPFSAACTINFKSAKAGQANLLVYRSNGDLIFTRAIDIEEGLNSISIDSSELGQRGLYIIKLDGNDQFKPAKLLLH